MDAPDAPSKSRRGFLAVAAAAAATTAAACTPLPPTALPPVPAPAPTAPPRRRIDAADPVHHVARRLAFGATPALLDEIRRATPRGWIRAQLDAPASWDASLDADLAAMFPDSRATSTELRAKGNAALAHIELPATTVLRAVMARRQLHEHLTAAWWDLLSVSFTKTNTAAHLPTYDLMLRGGLMGRFADLLTASARSGAMLVYLDNASSRADGARVPNENYARELLELYSVGVSAGYTLADVQAVAHLLSGWGWDYTTGAFTFRPAWHRLGPFQDPGFTVLGWSRGSLTGEAAGLAFLTHLARHRSTALRLAHRFAVRFIGEHIGPTHPLVVRAADAYQAADTALRPLYETILLSDEFLAAPMRRVRRPVELLAAGLRGLHAGAFPNRSNLSSTRYGIHMVLDSLSGSPQWWPAPNGYPDADGKWVTAGSLITRWNLASRLAAGNAVSGFAADEATARAWSPATTLGPWLDDLAVRLGIPLDDALRASLLEAVGRPASSPLRLGSDRTALLQLVALVMQTEQFQLR